MSTPRRRRHSPAVYRRRRLMVLLLVLLVTAGIVLAIWQPWRGGPAATPSGSTPSGTTTSAASDATATGAATDPAATATASDDPSADPAASDDALVTCTSADVTVVAITDQESYASGEKPQLSIELTNESAHPCIIDVGTTTQQFTITSGVDVWWRSTDCQSDPSTYVVTLDAGQTVRTSEPLEWDRTRSRTSTCESDRPSAGSGTYRLVVAIGGIESEPARFELR